MNRLERSAFAAHLSQPIRSKRAWLSLLLLTFFVYTLFIPRIMHAWNQTGDEPHYLVIIQSLVQDRDIDLRNNYALGPDIPHVLVRPDGAWRPTHDIGLPLVLALPYRLGGEYGVYLALALIAALVAVNTAMLVTDLGGGTIWAVTAWLLIAFLPPGFLYAFQLYPEMAGALLLIYSLRLIVRHPEPAWRWALVGGCAGLLPWLVARFATLSVFIALASLYAIYRYSRQDKQAVIRQALALLAPSLVLAACYLGFLQHFYGRPSPMAMHPGPGYIAVNSDLLGYLRLLVGWLVDQRMGLLVFSPVLATALLGLIYLFRIPDWRYKLVAAVALYHIITLVGLIGGFWVQFSIPNRYLVVIVPYLMIASALAIIKTRSLLYRLIAVLLIVISLSNTRLVMQNQQLAYPLYFNRSPLWSRYARHLHIDIPRFLPLMEEPPAVLKFNERLPDGKQVYFTSGFDVLQGAVVTDANAQSERAAAIDPLVGDQGLWLSAMSATAMPAGSIRIRVRAAVTDNVAQPADIPAFQVVISSNDTDTELYRQIFTLADFTDGAYHLLKFTFTNPQPQTLRIAVYYDDQLPLSLDFVSYQAVTSWWQSWGISILLCVLIIIYTLIGLRNR